MSFNRPITERALEAIKREAPHALAREMESAIQRLSSEQPSVRQRAAQDIDAMCHARVLGDINVTSIDWREWLQLLDKLRKFARRKERESQ